MIGSALRGISLANKCLLLFGGAVVLIVLLALSVPWLRMNSLVNTAQLELSRQLLGTWEVLAGQQPEPVPTGKSIELGGIVARRLTLTEAGQMSAGLPLLGEAISAIESDPQRRDWQSSRWRGTAKEYLFVKAVRSGEAETSELSGVLLMERRSSRAGRALLINTTYLVSAGVLVLCLALVVFYQITHRLILGPVRGLKETAERVRGGDLATRSEIKTGDEFEELAGTFNEMLAALQSGQEQLRSINTALDMKLTELTQMNSALYETAKLKGEFLANISHELRTPLNSIIGFAELLLEIARAEPAGDEPSPHLVKRTRYLENIVAAGRRLLEMINSLLEMAKLEAGKVDLHIERISLRDVCEGLISLIYPQADRRGIQLKLEVGDDLPMIETDPKRFQQVIFNFLSNAVKFTESQERTGRPGLVVLRAEKLTGAPRIHGGAPEDRVRISVIDHGPGIPSEEQPRVFEKFHQLDGSYSREHQGTGLGLAICKELAAILQGEIQLVSEVGRGSMFSLILPIRPDDSRLDENKLEARFRGALATQKSMG